MPPGGAGDKAVSLEMTEMALTSQQEAASLRNAAVSRLLER